MLFKEKLHLLKESSTYVCIGVFNTMVGYFSGVILYLLLENMMPAFLVSVLGSIISIFVTVTSYHFLFFHQRAEYLTALKRGYLSYGIICLGAALLFSYLVQIMNVWIAQGLTLVAAFICSTASNFLFVFKAKKSVR
ncbi:MAG: hypothetical protein VXY99_14680 [Pseudomonadota bacterium]|nr:hypothetical protein [Pseudomonadota bacterium]